MNCARFEQILLEQDPLPPIAQEHRLGCARCQTLTQEVNALDSALKTALTPAPLAADFDRRLWARLATAHAEQPLSMIVQDAMKEDAHQWELLGGKPWQDLLRDGLDYFGVITLSVLALFSLPALLQQGLPTGPLSEPLPFSAAQVTTALVSIGFCFISAIGCTLHFRRDLNVER